MDTDTIIIICILVILFLAILFVYFRLRSQQLRTNHAINSILNKRRR